MLQDMGNLEASCIFYVNVSMFTHLEQSKASLLTVNKSGIVRLTVQHWTDILHIAGLWETHATCSYTQLNSSCV